MAVLWANSGARTGRLLRVPCVQCHLCSGRAEYCAGALENGGGETGTAACCADRAGAKSDDGCTVIARRYERGTSARLAV